MAQWARDLPLTPMRWWRLSDSATKGNGTSVAMIDFSERITCLTGEATIGLVGSAA